MGNEAEMNQTPVGPYEPCPCGSGAKYKFCCRDKDRQAPRADAGPADFSRHHFDRFAEEMGLKERLGEQGAEEIFRLAREMHENRRTRKTRPLPRMETQVDPKLPAAAVDLSSAYPKPNPARTRKDLLRRGDPITRERLARINSGRMEMSCGGGRTSGVLAVSARTLDDPPRGGWHR